ncbi:hypothetical protein ACIBKY_50850 [Nonomuraea sp. NPDC050394]|uniref:hypothetical protein n=1 Tax=Nonomuraea sp. NPDC050394 TaxID=3364363 RepID=UPI0037A4A768
MGKNSNRAARTPAKWDAAALARVQRTAAGNPGSKTAKSGLAPRAQSAHDRQKGSASG